MSKITQTKLVEKLGAQCGITTTQSRAFIDGFKTLIYSLLKNGDTVELSGFGHFTITTRKARMGVHPRTLQPMVIKESRTPKFTAGEAFKEAINN